MQQPSELRLLPQTAVGSFFDDERTPARKPEYQAWAISPMLDARGSYRPKRLIQIRFYILDVFDAGSHPNEVLANTHALTHLGR